MSTILEARAIITAEDKTAAAFAAIEKRVKALSSAASSVTKPIAQIGKTVPSVFSHGKAIEKNGLGGDFRGGLGMIGSSTLGMAGGLGSVLAAHHAAVASAGRVHEKVRMQVAGMTREEIGEAEKDAAGIAAKFPSVGQTEIMHMLRNARSIVGSYKEAAEIMEPLVKLRVAAQLARPGQDVSEDFDQLVKGLEIKGVTQNPHEFHRYMEGIAKGLNTFGDTLKPYQYYEMFKYGRQATPGLSEQFILGTAPTLAQELGGSSYGKAVSAFNAAIVGGVMKHSALKEFVRMGLADKGDLDFTKTGEAKGLKPGRGLKGWQLAQSDPNAWVREYLLPAMEKSGIKDKEKTLKEISVLFQNQMASQMVGILATQQSRIDKDIGLLAKALGLDAAELAARRDPHLAYAGLKHSLESLVGTMGEATAAATAPFMNDTAKAIAEYTKTLAEAFKNNKDHPNEPTGAQKSFNRWANMIWDGTDSDAARPDVPIAERNRADYVNQRRQLLRQRGDAKIWADEEAEIKRLEQEPGGNLLSDFYRRNQLHTLHNQVGPKREAQKRLDEIEQAHKETAAAQRALDEFKRALPPNMSMLRPDLISGQILGSAAIIGAPTTRSYGVYDPKTGLPLPMQGPPMPPEMAAHAKTDDVRAALGGMPIEASVKPDQITAKLEGEANVNLSIRVEPSSELLRIVQGAREAVSSGNIKVNTGTSMPEANPNGRNR
jgi:hypothetical protein